MRACLLFFVRRFFLTGVGILVILVVRFVLSSLIMMEVVIMSLQDTLDRALVRLQTQERTAEQSKNALAEAEKLGLSASIVILSRECKRKTLAVDETKRLIAELRKALKK